MLSRGTRLANAITRLKSRLGHTTLQELRWIRRHVDELPQLPTKQKTALLIQLIEHRASGTPLQYVLGNVPFGPIRFKTRPPVLIPRSETEDWVTRLAEQILAPKLEQRRKTPELKILDLCTGTGCIPLLLCTLLPPGTVKAVGVDLSDEAVLLAQENAELLGFSSDPSPSRNTFDATMADITSDAFVSLMRESRFDVITCNPPYIPFNEYVNLSPEVKDHEDVRALLGDPHLLHHLNDSKVKKSEAANLTSDGFTFYRTLARLLPNLLMTEGAVCAVEFGYSQALGVRSLLSNTGVFKSSETWDDPFGIKRSFIGMN